MNCNDVTGNLQLYIDAELPPPDMNELNAHLGLCGDCNHRYQLEQLFKQTLKEKLPKRAASSAMLEGVRHAVLQND